MLNLPVEVDYGLFCEELLCANFGAIKVDSFDYSNYEGATYTCDMNKPLPPQLISNELKVRTIIDFGSLEHIYNAPQAFKNISTLFS